MKICEVCGKPIDEHKVWFWEHYYGKYILYCYKHGKARYDRFGSELRTNALWDRENDDHPELYITSENERLSYEREILREFHEMDVCDGNRSAKDEQ